MFVLNSKKKLMLIATDIKKLAPSVYAQKPDSKVSKEKYTFMPTSEIVGHLDQLGWGVHSAVQQNVRKKEKENTTKHMVKFRQKGWTDGVEVGDEIPEILLINSHDRTSSFKFHVGIHRLVCSNGMVVASQLLRDLKLRHINQNFEGIKTLVGRITEELPVIQRQIDWYKRIYMSPGMQKEFAFKALAARFDEYQDIIGNPLKETIAVDVNMDDFIEPLRDEDKEPNLWNLLNITQEKLTKGGFIRSTEKTRILAEKKLKLKQKAIQTRTVRPISNIGKYVGMNQELWALANHYANM